MQGFLNDMMAQREMIASIDQELTIDKSYVENPWKSFRPIRFGSIEWDSIEESLKAGRVQSPMSRASSSQKRNKSPSRSTSYQKLSEGRS